MFHCLVINVHCFSLSLDSLFNLSYLLLFVNNFFKVFSNFFEKLISVILFQRLNYFITSSVICQHQFYIFWKLTNFSVVWKHFLATACLLYHTQKHSSSTFLKSFYVFSNKSLHQFYLRFQNSLNYRIRSELQPIIDILPNIS